MHLPARRSTLAALVTAAILFASGIASGTDPVASPAAPAAPGLPASPPSIPLGGGPLIPKASAPDPKPFTLEDRFFDAARRGDLAMIKLCIDKGVDPKIKDEIGRSGLALAVRDARSLEVAEFLHERGLPVDEPDATTRTPLHEASGNGDATIAKWLLKEGARVDRKDSQGRTPLHNAIMGGSKEIASMLLEAGADLNGVDNFGDTPLMLACNKGVDEIAKMLVQKGADPSMKDQEGRTASQRSDENAKFCRSLPGGPPLPPQPPERIDE